MRVLPRIPLHRLARCFLYGATVSAVVLAGCSDGLTVPPASSVTAAGALTNLSGAAIPANARVVVLWSGDDDSGDYAYVFGEGTLDAATNRFSITFDSDVPDAALIGDALGVGFVILTTDPNLREGRVPDNYDYASNVIGVTAWQAVIYLKAAPSQFGTDWPAAFRRGYNVGRGVKADRPDMFDTFEPAIWSSMELIVDDLSEIEIVNWS